ncbi:MAG: phosphoribosylformylglycinamidine synthase subunit PurS [Phycisphaerae bacterium]|nr:phosphoribosylformylglycinamidine synthase subunit PurS [Phycisphaerae bacterium]
MSEQTAPALWRITVSPKRAELDSHGAAMLRDIRELGLPHVRAVASGRLFLIETDLPEAVLEQIASSLLADPITESYRLHRGGDERGPANRNSDCEVEVHLKGGVMDPVAASTLAAVTDMGIDTRALAISTARLYRLQGLANLEELEFVARRLFYNDCIEEAYLSGFERHDPRPQRLPVAPKRAFELRHVPLRDLDDAALRKLSREAHLFLSLEEMKTIQSHYRRLQRDPTDLELEMVAQTWSEHCVHKTLKSAVRYRGAAFPKTSLASQKTLPDGTVEVSYENLLRDTVARATNDLTSSGRVTWCLSVFKDNAGVIEFDKDDAVAFKVETHNHPSAIEPYGGAATGIGGCIRDVMGVGLGAKPIANTDIFCVGRPDFPMKWLPKGVLHPRRILKGIVAGVRDYGNRMGIPTVNGAVVFDNRYLGNPLVFCGCVGLMPNRCIEKQPNPGDLIVVIGGRTGRDGIHGATFSSSELTDTHADEFSHAVQIGDAITEKKVLDAMMRARDHEDGCLYTATTDCGAGGLSSAVGEMGEKLGADVELSKVPLKYAGLRYDEIWISEAQERMVLAVPPGNWEKVRTICEAENVEATVIGTFRNDGRLIIQYDGKQVGDIDARFLHGGVPKTRREATWKPAVSGATPLDPPLARGEGVMGAMPTALRGHANMPDAREFLLSRLSDLNTASKEWIIRQYDHEVQGASAVKSLVGPGLGPSDAAVLRPRLSSDKGIVLANGICPSLSDVDPYWMAVAAIDEALRNVICVGGDPNRTAILDNFCWGNCEDPQTMGALVRACQACYDAAVAFGTPFISGKDSLNNEFALDANDAKQLGEMMPLFNNRIRIPETLLISAMSVIEDVKRCVTMDAKPADEPTPFFYVGLKARQWPEVSISDAAGLHAAVSGLIRSGKVLAAHDCSDGGILQALAEMAFAGQCGIEATFTDLCPFSPGTSGYIVQTPESAADEVARIAEQHGGIVARRIATTARSDKLTWSAGDRRSEVLLADLAKAWRSGLNG